MSNNWTSWKNAHINDLNESNNYQCDKFSTHNFHYLMWKYLIKIFTVFQYFDANLSSLINFDKL